MHPPDPRDTASRPIAAWPESGGARVVFLLDVASGLEQRLLEAWIDRSRPQDVAPSLVEALPIPPTRRRRRAQLDPRLEPALATGDDPLLAPLRVAWLPAQRDGTRTVHLRDLLLLGDPRDPGLLRQAWVRWRHPDRCRVVAGEPAR